jgi:hypothetical protein
MKTKKVPVIANRFGEPADVAETWAGQASARTCVLCNCSFALRGHAVESILSFMTEQINCVSRLHGAFAGGPQPQVDAMRHHCN